MFFLFKRIVELKKIVFLQQFSFLRGGGCSWFSTTKRFHKFWFLVLENPGFCRGFLVIGEADEGLDDVECIINGHFG